MKDVIRTFFPTKGQAPDTKPPHIAEQCKDPLKPNINILQSNKPMRCLHCGAPSLNSEFCCNGCKTVFEFLKKQKLEEYYCILANTGETADTQADVGEFDINTDDSSLINLFETAPKQMTFYIPALKCAACLWLVDKLLSKAKGVQAWNTNLPERCIEIAFNHKEIAIQDLLKNFQQVGLRPYPAHFSTNKKFRTELSRKRIRKLGLAGASFGNIMLFATGSYFGELYGINHTFLSAFAWLQLLICFPTLVWCGYDFFFNAYVSILKAKLNTDLPIVISILVAFFVSIKSTLIGSGHTYYDSITGLIFFLLLGRSLYESCLERSSTFDFLSSTAIIENKRKILPGDKITVAVGEMFPVDGSVIENETEVNEATFTGESHAVPKFFGSIVKAGTINLLNPIKIVAQSCGKDTQIAKIKNLVDESLKSKSKIESNVEKILPWFVVGTFAVAVCGLVLWRHNLEMGVSVFATVFIVSCPCALALATPLLMSFSLQKAWREGVIIRNKDAFTKIQNINAIVCDKTGTLTTGILAVNSMSEPQDNLQTTEACREIASLAAVSKHPISVAIAKYLADFNEKLSDIKEIPGKGMSALGKTSLVLIGSAAWLKENGIVVPVDLTHQYNKFAYSQGLTIGFCMEDQLRTEANAFVAFWKQSHTPFYILSGDQQDRVMEIAKTLNIAQQNCIACATPQIKLDLISALQNKGKRVMLLGDGINDAAAMAKADLGVAMGSGIDLSHSTADIILQHNSLVDLLRFKNFAHYTNKTLNFILGLSIFYNSCAVALALSGILHPLVAAAIMPLFSLSVIGIVFIRKGNSIWKSFFS